MSKFNLAILLVLTFIISSCTKIANLSSVYRPFNTLTGTGALIDIKQRAILVGEIYAKDIKRTDGTLVKKKIVCAEPSPDSISSFLSETSANLDVDDKGKAAFNRKIAENAAFVGLRTQSIQLLRDSYFRLCEAYMNGAISSNDYDVILRRYQKHTIALLAIESLTGTVKVPQSTALQSNLSSQLIALQAKETSLKSKIKALADDKVNEKMKLTSELTETNKNYTNIITILKNASVSNSGAVSHESKNIASTVSDLTMAVLNTDYYGQLCWSLFAKNLPTEPAVKNACKKFFNLKNADLAQSTKLQERSFNDRAKQRAYQLKILNILKDKISKEAAEKVIEDNINIEKEAIAGVANKKKSDFTIFSAPLLDRINYRGLTIDKKVLMEK